jgi:putative membrane protein insertion efficiency factor
LIKAYQLTFSPDHGFWVRPGRGCRFYPSCSVYAGAAIEKFGLWRGLLKAAKRIFKCHPFSAGGVDFIEEK